MSVDTGPPPEDVPSGPVALAGDWSLWPLAGLRSAGWAAERVLALGGTGEGDGFLPEDRLTAAVEHVVRDPWFREALAWQNPALVANWLGDYADRLGTGDRTLRNRSRRQNEVARYVQRYATKNDTIGFFGPVSWARLEPAAPVALTVAGRGEEIRRTSHFEAWPVEELAAAWARDPALRQHLCPWRDPATSLRGRVLLRARRGDAKLTEDEAAVLALADGTTPPAAILARLRRERPDLGFVRLTEVLSVLGALARAGHVRWEFRLPLDERMEAHLLDQVRAVPDPDVRERYLEPLRSLLDLRERVDRSAGDPAKVLAALGDAATGYTAIGGGPAARSKAHSPTGRGLLWLDSLADWDVGVGAPALDAVRRPLALLLDICRWLTHRVAEGIDRRAEELVRRTGSGRMPVAALIAELAPELTGTSGGVLDEARTRMRELFAGLVGRPGRSGELRVACADIEDAWRAAFEAPGPGWEAARTHSPDLMLAAASPEDAADGRFFWVLGEIHIAVNTLDNRFFVANQKTPGAVERLVAASTRGTRYVPAFPRHWPDVTPRTYPPLTVDVPERFVHWSLEAGDTLPAGVPRVPCAGLDAVLTDRHTSGEESGRVEVTDGAGLRAPLTEFIGELLSFLVGNAFQLLPPRPHTPRVVMDDLVVVRETWQLPVDGLLDGLGTQDGERRLADRLRAAGVPRFAFARVPGDPKPIFCDLRSAPLVRNVLRLLRRPEAEGAALRLQEMLPGFEQLWLPGPDGRRTSEFRMVVVDRRG